MVLSDSFATTIFKEAFFRMFDKDDQGHLLMGFNATFDVQVTNLPLLALKCRLMFPRLLSDYKRAEGFGTYWTRHFGR